MPNQLGAPGGDETGAPGILRLFNKQLAGQIAWFLILAILGLVVAESQTEFQFPFTRAHSKPIADSKAHGADQDEQGDRLGQQLILWGLWLAPMILFFSFAGLFHRYYLEMLAPAIAALVGASFVAMWQAYARHRWRGTILPMALLIGATSQVVILWNWTNWNGWLVPFIIIASIAVALALFLLRILSTAFSACAPVATSGLLVLLVAPALWSLTPLTSADSALPFAGPEIASRSTRGADLPQDTNLIAYLNRNRKGAKFIAATPNANSAAPIILVTGEPVMALGGFSGSDLILTRDELAERVAANDVRLFLIPPQNNPQSELTQWITANCMRLLYFVPRGLLYDCARR